MSQMEPNTALIEAGVLELVRSERQKALSQREWKFRLRGYGYAVKTVDGTQVLTQLTTGAALGTLPPELG